VVLAAGVMRGGGSIITSLPAGTTDNRKTTVDFSPIDYVYNVCAFEILLEIGNGQTIKSKSRG
jgi:hypothetical protein